MSAMFNRLLAVDDAWSWFALEIALKGTVLLLLTASLVMLLWRTSAAVRHRVWALAFAGLLLLPLIQLAGPGLPWRVIPESWQPARIQGAAAPTGSAREPAPPAEPAAVEPAARAVPMELVQKVESRPLHNDDFAFIDEHQPPPHPADFAASPVHETGSVDARDLSILWLTLAWLIGAVVAALPLATGLLGNLRLRFHGERLADSDWQQLVESLCKRLGLRRNVTLLLGGPQQMPMTFGLLRPCVVVPSSALQWSPERQRIVLQHELAHVKRCDVPLQLIARLAAAVYWFHPLVWWALRQMRQEREHACDDCVLAAGQEAPDYATQLLEIARTHRCRSPLLNAAISMARPSQA